MHHTHDLVTSSDGRIAVVSHPDESGIQTAGAGGILGALHQGPSVGEQGQLTFLRLEL